MTKGPTDGKASETGAALREGHERVLLEISLSVYPRHKAITACCLTTALVFSFIRQWKKAFLVSHNAIVGHGSATY